MTRRLITCEESEAVRPGLKPVSALTNYVGGEVLDLELPPWTVTTWAREDDVKVLRDELDSTGCRHYLLDGER